MSKSAFRFFMILLFAALALYSCVLVPVYQIFASDLVLMDTIWFDIVDLLLQWTEIFGTAVLFSFAVFAAFLTVFLASISFFRIITILQEF